MIIYVLSGMSSLMIFAIGAIVWLVFYFLHLYIYVDS